MHKRSVPAVIILSLITFQIYSFYWSFKTRQELVNRGGDVPRFRMLLWPLLVFVAVVVLAVLSAFAGGAKSLLILLTIIVGVVGIVSALVVPFYWYYKYCKAAEKVTGGRSSFGLSYFLWIILTLAGFGWVWPGVMQSSFNQVEDGIKPAGDTPGSDRPAVAGQSQAA